MNKNKQSNIDNNTISMDLTTEEYEILKALREKRLNLMDREQNIIRAKSFKLAVLDRIKEYGYNASDNKYKYIYNYVRSTVFLRAGLLGTVNCSQGISETDYNNAIQSLDLILPKRAE